MESASQAFNLPAHTREDIQVLAGLVLEDVGWRFGTLPTVTVSDRFTRYRLGTAWGLERRINIYWKPMALWASTAVEDVIRHELAHVLATQRGYFGHHGEPWREACVELGALPRADADQRMRLDYAATNSGEHRANE